MSPNAFINKPKQPTNAELAAALGPAKATWDQLLTDLAQEFDVNVHEWNSYSLKAGWSLRVKRKARTIVWLAPCPGAFRVALILSDKAVLAAQEAKLPKRILKIINEAPKYPEGTGVRLEVKSSKDIATLKKLAAIKLAN
ncbi:MAG TPA: DUF3788 domain-containing protein [Candidatus Limnocylindrales bacterium]|nr:DUF3788 domain-containing protein [Candidatus Limnocylindrales bacterium]